MNHAMLRVANVYAHDDVGTIHGMNVALPVGPIGALVGTPADGTTVLASLAAGGLRPQRGQVRVANTDPFSSASTRAHIGSLLPNPMLPAAGTVRELLAFARVLRGGEMPRDEWFGPLHLEQLAGRDLTSLDLRERRSVALGLALACPSPLLLMLHEPLANVIQVPGELRQLLKKRAEQACVLVLTASSHDAVTLADDVATLRSGKLDRAIGAPDLDVLTPGSLVEVHVWSDAQRALASGLVVEASIDSVAWSSQPNAPLVVRASELTACASAIARVALATGAQVRRLEPQVPSTSEIHAASVGVSLAARYQAAYASGIGRREQRS